MKQYNDFVNEAFINNSWKNTQQKIINELNIDLYFVSTFGTIITAFYPFFYNLISNSNFSYNFTTYDIVLLTIGAIAIITKESNESIKKIKEKLKEKGIDKFLDKIIFILENITKLFKEISKIFNKSITSFVDLFSYTALFVPAIVGLMDLVNLYKLNFDDFSKIIIEPKGAIISSTIGVITVSLKHIINFIYKKILRNIKNKKTTSYKNEVVQKFENKNVELIYENYFNS